MASFSTISIRFSADLKEFSNQMDNARRSMEKAGKKMTRVGKNLTVGLTAPLTALGALSLKTFANFEQEMANVQAISGATSEEFDALRKNAEDLGAATRFAASEVATLQLNFSKLGLNPQEILNATEATLNLAQATGEDLAESATVAASTLQGFGLDATEATRVTDVMAKSFSSSALDLTKFSVAMATVAPVANVAGQSIEDTTGMLSVLVNAGLDASTAGTGLRNIFLDLAQSGMSLEEAFEMINTSTNKNKTAMDLFGKRGATVATVLADNIEQARELAEAYYNASGSAAEMAAIMDDTLEGAFFRMKSAMESALISIGEVLAPTFGKLADFISNVVSKFKELDPGIRKITVVVGALAAALGPVLVSLGFLMTTVVPGIIAALPALGAAFTALTGPIGLVVAAIAGIAAVVYKHWDSIKRELVALQNYFVDLYNESVAFRVAVEYISFEFKTLWNVVKLVFGSLYQIIKNTGKYIIDNFKNIGAAVKAVLTGNFDELPEIMRERSRLMGESFINTFKDIGGEFKKFSTNVKNDFDDAIDAVTKRKKITFTEDNVDASAITKKVAQAVVDGTTPSGRGVIGAISSIEIQPIETSPLDIVAEKMPAQVAEMSEEMIRMQNNALDFNEGLSAIMENTAANFAIGFGDMISQMASGGVNLKSLSHLILSTIGDMAIQIGKLAIGIGIAVEGIKKALQSLAGPVAIAAGIALVALGQFAKSALSDMATGGGGGRNRMPAFANGGIVYGPTVGLMGEYSGARTNPEVIAPLDRLKGMIADTRPAGVQHVEVTGVLKGTDMHLQNKRTNNYLNRRR